MVGVTIPAIEIIAMKRLRYLAVAAVLVLLTASGFLWLTNSYAADQRSRRAHSTYYRSFWIRYRHGMTLADLRSQHPEWFDESLDHTIRLVRYDHSIASHVRNRISQTAEPLAKLTGGNNYGLNCILNFMAEARPRPNETDYPLAAASTNSLRVGSDDSFIIWTSYCPIFIELFTD
jgi:hypothetical protein